MNQDNKEQKPKVFTDDGKFFFCGCGMKLSVDAYCCPSCGDIKKNFEAMILEKARESARKISIPMKPQKSQVFTDDGKFFFCECGAKVSVDAISCPSCGDTKTKEKAIQRQAVDYDYENKERKGNGEEFDWKYIWFIVVGIPLFIILVLLNPNSGDKSKPPYACQFSDGAVLYGIRSSVKERLNNPGSFEFIRSEKIDKGRYRVFFRGENAFGAIISKSAIVTVTKDCRPLVVRFE